MKKQNGKKAAANDKETKVEERYQIGSIATVKRGFLLAVVQWAEKKGTFSAEQLVAEFQGRSVEGKKITAERCHRYLNYCRVNGIVKVVKQ